MSSKASSKLIIDCAVAKRLAWVLKTLLGLEAFINIANFFYGTVSEDGEMHSNPQITYLERSTQSLSSALARMDLQHVGKQILHHCLFLSGSCPGKLEKVFYEFSDSCIGVPQWRMELSSWP